MLDRLKTLLGGAEGKPEQDVPARSAADVFNALRREVDPVAARAAAANPAEAAFYEQADRLTVKWHHYLGIYHRYLAPFCGTTVRLFEIGVHNGGSLQVWRRYLGPDAVIHGLDVDPRCAAVDDADLTVHIGSQDDRGLLGLIVDLDFGTRLVSSTNGLHVVVQITTDETLLRLVGARRRRCRPPNASRSLRRGACDDREQQTPRPPPCRHPRPSESIPMAEFSLPKNSQITEGKSWPATAGRQEPQGVPRLPLEPGRREEPADRHLSGRPRRLRADGARRAAVDQEQGRLDAGVPPLLPRGHLRLLRHEHRGPERARLHHGHRRVPGARARARRPRR